MHHLDDDEDALPPPIKRYSQIALQQHDSWLDDNDENDDEDDFDDSDTPDSDSDSGSDSAIPPPITRQRSTSLDSYSPTVRTPSTPPVPRKSPLRLQPSPEQQPTVESPPPLERPLLHSRNFSHPFKYYIEKQNERDQNDRIQKERIQKERNQNDRPPVYHHVPKLKPKPSSYRNNRRAPPGLRRRVSLETILSVTTTQSTDELPERPSTERTSTERPSTKSSFASFSTVNEENGSSNGFSGRSLASSLTPSDGTGSTKAASPGSSLLRKLKLTKLKEPRMSPESVGAGLRMDAKLPVYGASQHGSQLTESHSSLSQKSFNSADWKASEFDTSGLSPEELKKCKKKGINPSLYAEMKAARKGKWISPIGGNSIL
jgi:hypothetical protein